MPVKEKQWLKNPHRHHWNMRLPILLIKQIFNEITTGPGYYDTEYEHTLWCVVFILLYMVVGVAFDAILLVFVYLPVSIFYLIMRGFAVIKNCLFAFTKLGTIFSSVTATTLENCTACFRKKEKSNEQQVETNQPPPYVVDV
jgi:hypothetical protein